MGLTVGGVGDWQGQQGDRWRLGEGGGTGGGYSLDPVSPTIQSSVALQHVLGVRVTEETTREEWTVAFVRRG